MTPLDRIRPYAKAVVAFIAPGVTALVSAVQDGSQAGSAVSGPEWVGIAAACILTCAAVYTTPNAGYWGGHKPAEDEGV